MKVKNAEEIRKLIMNHPKEFRRIFSISAHIDHGKSTTADYLLAKAGLMSAETAGEKRMTDSDEEEQERGITIFTTVVILSYDYLIIEEDGKERTQTYLFQINDTPGHLSFTGEVSRALRGSDGAVILVDALEGMMTQTETNIQLSVGEEACKPVLFINKVDRLISELRLDPKDVFGKLDVIVSQVNNLIKKVAPPEFKKKWNVSFPKNSIAVGSAKDGWAFTVEILKLKGLTPQFVFEKYAEDDKKWLRKNLPLDDALLRMVIQHIPNPGESQIYKIPKIWHGDLESEAGKSLIACDPKGPLLGMITKIFIDPKSKRATLIGRIFSGTLKSDDTIYLVNRRQKQRVKRLGVMELTDILDVPEIPAGNLFAMYGFICPAGESFYRDGTPVEGFDKISYAAEPVVSRAISPKSATDLSKLGEVVNTWIMADPTASYELDQKTKKIIVRGIDPLQIDILVTRIDDQVPINTSDPVIVHRETISRESISYITKSNNSHNRIELQIRPLSEGVVQLLRAGKIDQFMERKERSKLLQSAAGDSDDKFWRGYWGHSETNILVENTKGVQRLDRIKEFVIQAWNEFCKGSTLAGEPLTGVLFEIKDATVHVDPAHTGVTEIVSMMASACNLTYLSSKPRLLEPLMRIEIKTPVDYVGALTGLLTQKRGIIEDIAEKAGATVLKAVIPTVETMELADDIRGATAGRGFFGYEFARFEDVPPHLFDKTVESIRIRNELKPEIPSPSTWERFIYKT
ncbi:MAG: GTP-binding protein [Candidatus Heimdallarchaeota archaeon]|nr:GTP-binding protein [Candidatus Heimdallarchaeota archaeon]